VAIHYNRSEDGASALAAQICSAGGTAKIVQANLAVPQDVDSLIARAAEALGTPLSALIGPGPTLANVHQKAGEFDAEVDATLLRAPSHPDALLDGVRYLLGAASVTGQMIAIDSGQHLLWQTPDILLDGHNAEEN